jgi:hypothetical protein
MGAGIGEGNEGVECGREGACLAALEVEREIECDADEIAACEAEIIKVQAEGKHWAGSSYNTHEMVGIGGKVKMKLKQQVKVGAAVKQYKDERESGSFLKREQNGDNRSWCSWCERVVPATKDLDHAGKSTDSVASSSTSASS